MITETEILNFQKEWGDGIISIGRSYNNEDDYIGEAKDFIFRLYAYETESVLFKPTLASDIQFRIDKISALSYFVGGNKDFLEDKGFAIKGWNKIRWENTGIKIIDDCAICMGNYYFGKNNEEDLKVEYSMVLRRIGGDLKIILHDSHLPYQA